MYNLNFSFVLYIIKRTFRSSLTAMAISWPKCTLSIPPKVMNIHNVPTDVLMIYFIKFDEFRR